MSSIVVIGSANTDLIINSERLPLIGETVIGHAFHMMEGGKGANQAVAIKRLGGKVNFLCCVGDDIYGNKMREKLGEEGFDLAHVRQVKDAHSGIAMIMVDDKAQNCILVAPGANHKLSPATIDATHLFSEETEYLLLQLEIPLNSVAHAIAKAKERGIRVVLNAAPAQKLDAAFLAQLDILIVNETEASILTNAEPTDMLPLEDMGRQLNAQGVGTIVFTLGEEGTYVYTQDQQFHVPAFSVKAVDTTAAGDTFCGALMHALCQGRHLKEAVRFANAAAALAVTRLGAQGSIPQKAEVERFMQQMNPA